MSDQEKTEKQNVHAEDNSIAVGSISAGGKIGEIHIGNAYQTPEDVLPLSSDEIESRMESIYWQHAYQVTCPNFPDPDLAPAP
jgi:hypothetical protein